MPRRGGLERHARQDCVSHMSPLRARVEKERLVLDEPTTVPDGTAIDLVADDEGDDLTGDERQALHEALSASWKSAEAGRLQPASAILDSSSVIDNRQIRAAFLEYISGRLP